MRKLVQLLLLSILCNSFVATTSDGEVLPMSLVGTYLIEEQGNVREFIRITYQAGTFLILENQNGHWSSQVEVLPVSRAEFENLLGEPVNYSFSGLANESIALFRVPRGWRSGNFTCLTGYWLMTIIGPIEVIKKQ